ncbi:hypothetical protein WA026_019477 [Henosepilachna vigintioctopunctata]|uniref:Uncharacterized protein n=1 Tax=Henosepilachna vigintioctopunctata TaxID=420089 RepID=A0AAW1U237_9CUCU
MVEGAILDTILHSQDLVDKFKTNLQAEYEEQMLIPSKKWVLSGQFVACLSEATKEYGDIEFLIFDFENFFCLENHFRKEHSNIWRSTSHSEFRKMDIKKINSVCSLVKPTLNLKDLPSNTVFPITNAYLKKRKFGTAILLELNDQFVYLPQRRTEVLKDKLNYLKEEIYGLKVTGLKEYANLPHSVLFEIVEL